MSRVVCDIMDCKHIEPIQPIRGGEPFLGHCKAECVNIFGCDQRKCITYEKAEEDDGEREQLFQKGE